ncbi:signal transduction histidine kinase [Nonomuraea thailandensis]|uniref:histidine kinase n=1 Tax=Nonomuraea thailandensis TaxID=1188745 RepID=A0A9X2GXR1_9ACTN|nr:sensor histidine kinase [Nonomuraea thailandensis]MCP2363751.1 signal transduction histidine kinase [Nonomuraea thailandensis]
MPTQDATPARARALIARARTARAWALVAHARRPVARAARARVLVARARATLDGLEHLVGGMGTAALALIALTGMLGVAVACLSGVGLRLLPAALRGLRVVAGRERTRLSRWGPQLVEPEPVPGEWRAAIGQPAARRELAWMSLHATLGLLYGLIALTLPFAAVRDLLYPLYWWLLPAAETADMGLGWRTDTWPGAIAVSPLSLAWLALALLFVPGLAQMQAWPGRRFLSAGPGTDLALRVAQLTATRAAALDAHATELRRIERSLHDGAQNRLVAVNVLVGAARRALTRDPATADELLERAQDTAEQALAELRAVVRGILPPVLAERSLAGALSGLAAACPVPCRIDAEVPGRFPASVEATAYFVVAEALTNVARHSRASRAVVTVRGTGDRLRVQITDDGRGGAAEAGGSGLGGIRRRAEAHDGTFELASPPGGPTTLVVSLPCGL